MNNGGKNKEDWSDAIERARDMFDSAWKELGQAADKAKSQGEDAWKDAQKKGREAWVNARAKGMESWEDAKERGVEAYDMARERGEVAFQDAEKLFRKYPSKTVGLSLLLGVLIGALLTRDRD